ncbi:MAG: AhpC/TSA family protein [Paramuribaculum sp.]|nr:AhpC/TSA family protein [Paramuribaculum sp.]
MKQWINSIKIMIIRKILKLAFLISVFSAPVLKAQIIHYKVEGTIEGYDGMQVKMSDYGNNHQIIDTATVFNGKFYMEGDYSRHALVRFDIYPEYANCILDSLIIPDFQTHLPKPYSELNTKYYNYRNNLNNYNEKLMNYVLELQADSTLTEDDMKERFFLFKDNIYPDLKYFIDILTENANGLGEDALWFQISDFELTPTEWDEIFTVVPYDIKKLPYTIFLNSQYQAKKKALPGSIFIDLEGKNITGDTIRLSDFIGKGKYVLVDFWASWCSPCLAEGKETLIPLYDRYADNPLFEIVGIATCDSFDNSIECIEQQGYKWPQILDAGMTPMELYGFNGIPMIMLFDPEGIILERDIRGQEIENAIKKYLSE